MAIRARDGANKQVEKYKDELDEGSGGKKWTNISKTIMFGRVINNLL